ncbi:MAG: hypothetical protein NTW38_10950 [Candidatus Aminicenantes bacterium]|nr:hypothetical protein [Candidatus Aminicenantes bacterium]
MNIVKVLDVTDTAEDVERNIQEQFDRKLWESRASTKSVELMDKIIKLLPEELGIPRITYNRTHVGLGINGYNFYWFNLRKGNHIHLIMKLGPDAKDAIIL